MLSFSLLMTASIRPTVKFNNPNFRADPILRLNDYKIALKYWLNYKDERIINIIFVDNSTFDLCELKNIAKTENKFNRGIEFIQFNPETIPNGLHYGFSELEIIDTAILKSSIVKNSLYIIKVTGRLFFPNLNKLLNKVNDSTKIIIDFKDYKIFKFEKHYANTTLIIFRLEFFNKHLINLKSKMDPDKNSHFENLYFNFLKNEFSNDKNVVTRFPFNVNPKGIGAHWSVNYSSPKKRIIFWIQNLFRIIYPKLKF